MAVARSSEDLPRVGRDQRRAVAEERELEGREREIRDAALTLFSERGYHGTTVADIAGAVGIRAPSLYNHVSSKQQILVGIMYATMEEVSAGLDDALASSDDPIEQLRRATEAHVRFHTRNREAAKIGNTEIRALEEPERSRITELRRIYAQRWEELIRAGIESGAFKVSDAHLTAFAILEMGIGVARWFRLDGPLSEAIVAYQYADMALRLVGVQNGSPKSFPVTGA